MDELNEDEIRILNNATRRYGTQLSHQLIDNLERAAVVNIEHQNLESEYLNEEGTLVLVTATMLVHITPPAEIIPIEPPIPPGGGGGNGGNLVTREEFLAHINDSNVRFNAIENRLENVENRLENLETRMENVENRLENVEIRLDRLEVAVNEHIITANRRFDRMEDLLVQILNK